MRNLVCLVLVLFSAGLARAEWPFDAPKEAAWPFKVCDCAPCTCDPKTCACPNCDAGCKKGAQATQEVAFVGSDPFQTAPAVVESQTPQGYHVEYRQVCNGSSCQMVPTMVANGQTAACASCGTGFASSCSTGNCSTGSCGAGGSSGDCGSGSSGSCGRNGPIRRVIGRIFRGRR